MGEASDAVTFRDSDPNLVDQKWAMVRNGIQMPSFQIPDGNKFEVTTSSGNGVEQMGEPRFWDQALLLDVRSPGEYKHMSLPKSLLVPHEEIVGPDCDGLHRVLDAVGGERAVPIAVYCRRGNRSQVVKEALEKNGFTNVRNAINIVTVLQSVGKNDDLLKDTWRRYAARSDSSCALPGRSGQN